MGVASLPSCLYESYVCVLCMNMCVCVCMCVGKGGFIHVLIYFYFLCVWLILLSSLAV